MLKALGEYLQLKREVFVLRLKIFWQDVKMFWYS